MGKAITTTKVLFLAILCNGLFYAQFAYSHHSSYFNPFSHQDTSDLPNIKTDSVAEKFQEREDQEKPFLYNTTAQDYLDKEKYDQAIEYGKRALEWSAITENTKQQRHAERIIGVAYYLSSDFPNAILYLTKATDYLQTQNDSSKLVELSRYLGGSYYYTGNYQKAYENFLLCYDYFTTKKDTIEIANTLGNIGNIYLKWREYDKALDYFNRSLDLGHRSKDSSAISTSFNNIANVYFEIGNYQKTIDYNMKSLHIKEQTEDSIGMATSYNNIAGVYFKQQKYHDALEYYKKALEIYTFFKDKKWMSMVYNNIGFSYEFLNQPDKALKNYHEALRLGRETNYSEQIIFAYESFSEVYRSLGDYKQAFHYLEKHKNLNDSIFNEQKHRQLAEMEARFENKEKQKEIELLNRESQLSKEKLKRRNIVIYAFIFITLLLGLLVFFIWHSFKLKKNANKLLREQNEEIKEKNEELNQQREEIETQRDELEAQRDQLIDQKNQISSVYREINSSIEYASTIQRAFLPPAPIINRIFPDNFIYFKPKETVSGDFYWVEEQGDYKFIAVGDCTGHGVPGALLSILGMTALNEIFYEKKHLKASDILNTLKQKVIKTLHQTQSARHPMDSMEVSICLINTKEKTINYSGSFNSILIFHNDELQEIKADRLPIGFHPLVDRSFTDKTLPYSEGDCLYLFTDGYPDQKNHVTGKKFLKSRFKRLINEIHCLPPEEQHTQLANNFEFWKGQSEQIDDVLIAGIKL
jgi:serine phosphatase RsbU (regulator of sigma subunit)/uncharacterized protein HemY